jgi:ribonuclease E
VLNPEGPAQAAERDENAAVPREARTRDRYGRERRPRQERGERSEIGDSQGGNVDAPMAAPQAPLAVAASAVAPVAQHAAAGAGTTHMPQVTPFDLPVDSLLAVAQQSGLQWVNSDAQRVAAVQAAIASEPTPVHAPRERPAPVVLDSEPLVLVETRKDLRNMTLPFEQTTSV